jgi:hypothetical protein
MRKDPELAPFVDEPQVNYWLGPDAHAGMSLSLVIFKAKVSC